ncbi:MAG: helix-turn-helix transcriptional regulator [Clostridia bacterium]|nr:helix-turn-helix transcriptional regulator [Clostridia bacterium]
MKKRLSEKQIKELLQKYRYRNSENDFHRLPLERGDMMLSRIRSGQYRNMDFLPYEELKDRLGATASTPKKSFEYDVVAAITLFSRAAIDGGVLPEESFDLSDVLLQEVEKTSSVEELFEIYQTAALLFAKLVADKRRVRSNYQVEQCRAYVQKNLFRPITVGDVAASQDLTPNYLSSLFRKSEGICLHTYIEQEKIRVAQDLLAHSTEPISVIALSLGFKTQAHFSDVFRRHTDLTPSAYRNLHFRSVARS